MKKFFRFFFIALVLFILVNAAWYIYKMNFVAAAGHRSAIVKRTPPALAHKLRLKTNSLREYARSHQFNTQFCFLIDMSLPSGSNRFFVYNLDKDSLADAGLVTHGRCNEDWLQGRKFSNRVGGGCTSLGKYKVGTPYHGKFGLAYKLHGLDSTNSNAFKRFVVLHSHSCVPNGEVDPYPICQSDGCPTVSVAYLKKLAALIDGSKRPVLLYIFE